MAWIRLDADIFDHPKMIDLSIGAQYLFIRLCCTMKSSSEKVSLSASYWSPKYWSKRCEALQSECEKWLSQLHEAGLIEYDGDRLAIHNWREYQPDPTANDRKAAQRGREKEIAPVTNVTPCHSDNRASRYVTDRTGQNIQDNTDPPLPPTGVVQRRARTATPPEGFAEFWAAYPRKTGKAAAQRAWEKAKDKPPLADVLSAIERQRRSDQWCKDSGQFIPLPATWLNQGRWDDVPLDEVQIETPEQRRKREREEARAAWLAEPEAPGRRA